MRNGAAYFCSQYYKRATSLTMATLCKRRPIAAVDFFGCTNKLELIFDYFFIVSKYDTSKND